MFYIDFRLITLAIIQIDAIKARLHGSEKGKLVAQKPIDDAPKIDLHIGSTKMAPPTYKLGEKVSFTSVFIIWNTFVWSFYRLLPAPPTVLLLPSWVMPILV